MRLPRSGGVMISRRIGRSDSYDLMGTYPLFCCADWQALKADLDDLRGDFVCASVVTDPLGGYTEPQLNAAFDSVRAFKSHYVADVTEPQFESSLSKSHRRLARRALQDVEVEVVADPLLYLDEWVRLYEVLCKRHDIAGLRQFSRDAFSQQLATPGMTMFRSSFEQKTVCLDLWYRQGEVAQGHLVAVNDVGYQLRASYASKLFLLRHFAQDTKFVNLGGVAGTTDDQPSGLTHFKAGWSNSTCTAYFCWRILNAAAFSELAKGADPRDGYFPPYRQGEF